jgi:hydroxymethylpyrimidine pyrophosphatase-like HAD family hydrolase
MAIGNGPNDKDMIDIAGIGVTTEPKVLPADYHTTKDEHLGGEELVDKLLELKK